MSVGAAKKNVLFRDAGILMDLLANDLSQRPVHETPVQPYDRGRLVSVFSNTMIEAFSGEWTLSASRSGIPYPVCVIVRISCRHLQLP